MASKLTNKQKLFVQEYLVDLNATQAAIRAGYSEKTANRTGAENLSKPVIQQEIQRAVEKQKERTQIRADKVLKELVKLGFSDIRGVFNEDGTLKRPEEWSDAVAAAVSSVEVVTKSLGEGEVEYVHKIKLWDKNKPLEMIGKHLKMFTEKHEHSGEDGQPLQQILVYIPDNKRD